MEQHGRAESEQRYAGTRLLKFKTVGRKKDRSGRHYTQATFPKNAIGAEGKTNAKR